MAANSKVGFLALKSPKVEPIRLHFGPLMEGGGAHSPDIFGFSNFLVTREIVDFRQNFGIFFLRKWAKVQLPKFYP